MEVEIKSYVPDTFERQYVYQELMEAKYIKYSILRRRFVTEVIKSFPDIDIRFKKIHGKLTLDIVKELSYLAFNDMMIGIYKDDFLKYNLELRKLYWKIIFKDMMGDINESTILTWYSITDNRYLYYPLNASENYEDPDNFESTFYIFDRLYGNINYFVPTKLYHNNSQIIKYMSIIELIEGDKKQILLHNKFYPTLSKHIKGEKDIDDEMTEYNFYGCDNNILVRKLFRYEDREITLC